MKKHTSFILTLLWLLSVMIMVNPMDVLAASKVKKITLKTSTNVKTVYIGGASTYRYTTIEPTISPKNASKSVTYTSSKQRVATVSKKGKVKGLRLGTTTVTVRSKTNRQVKASIKITVKNYKNRIRPADLTANISKQTLKSGETAQITYVLKPAAVTNKKIKFKSFNTKLAVVNSKGIVTANSGKETGTVKVRIYTVDKDKKGKQLYKDFNISINPAADMEDPTVTAESITLNDSTIQLGSQITLSPTFVPANVTDKTLEWYADDTSVAEVNKNGVVTTKKMGIVNITAQTSNGKTAACQLTVTRKSASVHDPSIFKDFDGTYYVFGTHFAAAKSSDLIGWDDSIGGTKLFGVGKDAIVDKLSNIYAWINSTNVSDGNTWAADIIYNKTTKKYYYYASTSAFGVTNSLIWFATADEITGPYSDPTPIIYSGFNSSSDSNEPLSYLNTNISELIDNGTLDGTRSNWFNGSNYNDAIGKYPNAIDPAVFYDADGRMWMTYGSYFGGIYILELDESTGMPIYPGEDSGNTDRYFGTLIATSAGNAGQGEGPYILYDTTSNYYYLYVTYGGLSSTGGYNIRVFRSANPDGPYVDAAGNPGTNGVNKGTKLFGNYQFLNMSPAYMSGGHNSVIQDSDGKVFNIYHTRFSDESNHQVRNHQMFLNEDGWPVVMPYEYNGETISNVGYSMDQIVGTYEYINHGNTTDTGIQISEYISLNNDGSISGAVQGTWVMNSNTPYVTFTIDDISYKGVFCIQTDETTARNKVMTFSAVGSNNKTIWGSMNAVKVQG